MSLEEARQRGLLNEQGTRQLWQLLGMLEDDELVIQLPVWLAAEKVGSGDRTAPTLFVERLARETEKAVLLEDSAAQSLMSLAHRIHSLEDVLPNTDTDHDRHGWLASRLRETQGAFRARDGMVILRDEWVLKSHIRVGDRRKSPAADRP